MYTNHFKLEVLPFESTPDPAFFFPGPQYRETLAAMIHCVASRKSLMVVSGPIGSGKTTLGRTLTRYLSEGTRLISILHPFTARGELISFVAHQVGLEELSGSKLIQVEELQNRLVQLAGQGKRILIIIDEAQLLSSEDMEEIRLLTNLETETAKLVQIILLGQPELIQHLQATEARPLRQRLSSVKILKPMERSQVINYIRHRLKVAGGDPDLFSQEALEAVAVASTGIPRLVNQICDQALLNAFAVEAPQVDRAAVSQVVSDMSVGQGLPAPLLREEEPAAGEKARVPAKEKTPEGLSDEPRIMEFQEAGQEEEEAGEDRTAAEKALVRILAEEPPSAGEEAPEPDRAASDAAAPKDAELKEQAPEPEKETPAPAREEEPARQGGGLFSGGMEASPGEERSTSIGEEYGIELGPLFRPGGMDIVPEEEEDRSPKEAFASDGPVIKSATPLSEKGQDKASIFSAGKDLDSLDQPSKMKTWIPAVVLLILALMALGASLWIFFNHL